MRPLAVLLLVAALGVSCGDTDERESLSLTATPDEGVVIDTEGGGVAVVSLDGQLARREPGLQVYRAADVRVATKDGRRWALDADSGEFRLSTEEPPDDLLVRKPKPPGTGDGHWRRFYTRPDGVRLGQWSDECEVPGAFRIDTDGKVTPVLGDPPLGFEAFALGWTRRGEAVIQVLDGACGVGGPTPGVYVVDDAGKPRLVVALDAQFAAAYFRRPLT